MFDRAFSFDFSEKVAFRVQKAFVFKFLASQIILTTLIVERAIECSDEDFRVRLDKEGEFVLEGTGINEVLETQLDMFVGDERVLDEGQQDLEVLVVEGLDIGVDLGEQRDVGVLLQEGHVFQVVLLEPRVVFGN